MLIQHFYLDGSTNAMHHVYCFPSCVSLKQPTIDHSAGGLGYPYFGKIWVQLIDQYILLIWRHNGRHPEYSGFPLIEPGVANGAARILIVDILRRLVSLLDLSGNSGDHTHKRWRQDVGLPVDQVL